MAFPPNMKRKHRPWPLVPGGPASPGYGSGRGNYGEEGARNLRVTGGCQRNQLTLATYNGRTIRLDNHLAELEVELSHIKWHILGLSEVRREGEDTITLESGHLLYFREGDKASQGGVGFLVNKSLVNNVVEVSSVSNRVAYLVLKLTNRYSLKVIQVYAPTSAHPDEEVEAMYEDITKAIHGTTSAHYNVVMGDFNAKVGVQECDEPKIGPYGLGRRNHRGQMLVNFLEMQGLFLMNSFYKKKLQRRWTWQSPDTVTKNEIDFIMADKKHIFRDVSVVNRFNTGSDHRLVRGTLNIDFKAERLRLIKSNLRPTPPQIILGSEQFQLELQNRFESLETTGDVDEITDNVVKTMRELGRRHFPPMRRSKRSELSTETLDLMRMRHIPEVDIGEIRTALGQLKNGRAPGDDGITTELLKAGGIPILKALAELFNSVILRGTVPRAWTKSAVVLFFKKGDKTLLKNYRPISLLSHVYKLFSRVITNRLARRLDEFQPPEQAGFRKGYSTVDHIHTVRQIIQKTEEYNQPLCMAFVDYEKAFDSIETWAVLESLQRCRIDWRYIEVLRCLYDAATMTVQIQDRRAKPIPLRRGVRQGDVISPKLFTNAMEDVFKTLEWNERGININGERISHLRFADDIVVFAETLEGLTDMLNSLNESSRRTKYKVNPSIDNKLTFITIRNRCNRYFFDTVSDTYTNNPNDSILIVGDFNIPSAQWNPPGCNPPLTNFNHSDKLIQSLFCFLSFTNLSQFNLIPNINSRQLDLIICSSKCVVDRYCSPLVMEDSYHPALHITLSLVSLHTLCSTSRLVRAFRKANYTNVNHELAKVDWTNVMDVNDIDEALDNFYDIINGVIATCVPSRICCNNKYPLWYSLALRKIITEKLKYHKKWKIYGRISDYNTFCLLRDREKPSLRRFCAVLASRPRLLYFHALYSIPNSRFHT
ncbi:hypothetical protein K1T71_005291 [Dendrolimus kikuchii]|uniref:Uncharacterized protein n=1 Tax=Dendrolimus kikuchii TaxID=765133 RepID=A0ACC1D6Q0_9NEOP|nr:hypothetical protein K1T71_005291 [Dendrolimus kikuchii]